MTQKFPLVFLTHIDRGAFCDIFFLEDPGEHVSRGPPKKSVTEPPLSMCVQERLILRSIPVLREREGSFTSTRLIQYNRIHSISDHTVRRLLNRNGYHYLQARKKGLMSASDRMKRVAFARRILNNYPPDV